MLTLTQLLQRTVEEGASDLIVKTGSVSSLRVRGHVEPIDSEQLGEDQAMLYLGEMFDEREMQRYVGGDEVDLAYELVGLGRFRVNVFRQLGKPAMVFRYIKSHVPTFTDLALPAPQLEKLAQSRRGLILATGVAGSGKSTTLASMVEWMNQNLARHVVTVEDPVEYIFSEKNCIITQREIGHDSKTFSSALKYCLRQAPDVIVLGEMRDRETIEAAINAAESGHLVMSTLHTINAVQTVERILSYFSPEQQALIRLQLSMVLQGVISLRLMNTIDQKGRIPAVELLMSTPSVREVLKEGRTWELRKVLAEGQFFGTQTFDQCLARLYREGRIDYHDALATADNPDELKLEIAGVTRGARLTDLKV
ncbi:MAG: PilT/PilU family type 4a pilus ATPase [Planctomycetes bacterium]|nr:PilT/PilU family type 4a pilus ATPase [Planctomycetota bacterium]